MRLPKLAPGLTLGFALGVAALTGTCSMLDAQAPAAGFTRKHLYDEQVDPRTKIAEALTQAKREHKRVILDFGGDWCGDCQVLDIYFHQQENAALLNDHFLLVHVFIGHMDKNLDLAKSYGVPIENGVPALSVLDSNGKVIHAQKNGAFADMRHMDAGAVHDFLEKWKA